MMAELPKVIDNLGGHTLFFSIGEVDEEWVDLILYALELGIPLDEIREFLNNSYNNSH